jgi:hypothetical protein
MMNIRTIVEGLGGVLAIAGTVVLSPVLASWYRRWGTTEAEAVDGLYGDELVPHPRSQVTCAIMVRAPAERVWPWLVQIGCQRAGWYSYDLLDNGGLPSADRVLAEHQSLSVGDSVQLMPDGRLGMPVVTLVPDKALVLGGTLNTATGEGVHPGEALPEAYYAGINAFVLEPAGATATRLIFRQRLDWSPSRANTMMYRVFLEPISFVMARRMLKGIKRRAERQQAG